MCVECVTSTEFSTLSDKGYHRILITDSRAKVYQQAVEAEAAEAATFTERAVVPIDKVITVCISKVETRYH